MSFQVPAEDTIEFGEYLRRTADTRLRQAYAVWKHNKVLERIAAEKEAKRLAKLPPDPSKCQCKTPVRSNRKGYCYTCNKPL